MKTLRQMVLHPIENVVLWIGLIVLLLALWAIASSSAADWRYLYCQSDPAHAIECTAKGWW